MVDTGVTDRTFSANVLRPGQDARLASLHGVVLPNKLCIMLLLLIMRDIFSVYPLAAFTGGLQSKVESTW